MISKDGSVITYESMATNLVAGQVDTNDEADIFQYGPLPGGNGTMGTTLVSRSAASATTTGDSAPSVGGMSSDGRYVVYDSDSTNVVSGQTIQDPFDPYNVFLFDRVAGTTRLVSHVSQGSARDTTSGSHGSYSPTISGNGEAVAFESDATDLVAGQISSNVGPNVFLYDAVADTTVLVSHSTAGPTMTANGPAGGAQISADGNSVFFSSTASDLALGNANNQNDLFLFTNLTDTTPVTTLNAIQRQATGTVVLATFTAANDGNPPALPTDFTATVNWGGSLDGVPTWAVQLASRAPDATTWQVVGSATYSYAGHYSVGVTVSDKDGINIQTSNTSINVEADLLVSTTTDFGAGSLRQALLLASGDPETVLITFDIGTGRQTIQLLSPLPAITSKVVIDGTTEPGYAGSPLVVLDGSAAGDGASGLLLDSGSDGSIIRGLAINNFRAAGTDIRSSRNTIQSNYLGIDASGSYAGNQEMAFS